MSREIIGIVGDAKYQTLRSEIAPTVYVPQKGGDTTFEVRTAVNPATIIPAVRSMLSQLDNNLPLSNLKTQSEQISQDRVLAVTGNCYSELGASPFLGRLLTPEDSSPWSSVTSQIAVIGYEFWRRRFGGTLDVVGKQIRIEGHPFTIIGVTRKWFTGMTTGEPPDITVPLTAMPLVQSGEFDIGSRSNPSGRTSSH